MLHRRCPYRLSSRFEICVGNGWFGARGGEGITRERPWWCDRLKGLTPASDMQTHQGGEEHEVVVVHPQHVPLLELAHLRSIVVGWLGGGDANGLIDVGNWCWLAGGTPLASHPSPSPCTHLDHHVAEELIDLAVRLPPVLLAAAVPDLLRVRLLVVPVRPGGWVVRSWLVSDAFDHPSPPTQTKGGWLHGNARTRTSRASRRCGRGAT